jgi:hypothetical protein
VKPALRSYAAIAIGSILGLLVVVIKDWFPHQNNSTFLYELIKHLPILLGGVVIAISARIIVAIKQKGKLR